MTQKERAMKHVEERDPTPQHASGSRSLAEGAARILFLFAGGLLLSALVSCACGPVR